MSRHVLIELYGFQMKSITYCCISELVHYNCDAVSMSFCQNTSFTQQYPSADNWRNKHYFANLSNVDFPAPRNPQMIVKGTREGDSEMISVASVSVLVESTTDQ